MIYLFFSLFHCLLRKKKRWKGVRGEEEKENKGEREDENEIYIYLQ